MRALAGGGNPRDRCANGAGCCRAHLDADQRQLLPEPFADLRGVGDGRELDGDRARDERAGLDAQRKRCAQPQSAGEDGSMLGSLARVSVTRQAGGRAAHLAPPW